MQDQQGLQLVAQRIAELRDIMGYDTLLVANMLGIGEEAYKSYEINGEDIPISLLYKLANLYQVDMTDLLSGQSPRLSTLSVVRAGKGLHAERYAGYLYEDIGFNFAHRSMLPMLVTLNPDGRQPELVTHSGQEINYCLEGEMLLLFDDLRVALHPGDCAYFDPSHPHGQQAAGGAAAKFLTVIQE